jgi:hypothetical protein
VSKTVAAGPSLAINALTSKQGDLKAG